MERPKCKCHGQLMRKSGSIRLIDMSITQLWRCRIKADANQKRYYHTPKGKQQVAQQRKRWAIANPQKIEQIKIKYERSVKGLVTRRRHDLKSLREKYTDQLQQLDAYITTLMEGSNA